MATSGQSILFITKSENASSTRYRVSDYLPYWAASGWTVNRVTHDGSLRAWLNILRSASQADVVVILRRTFRFPFLGLLRRVSRYLVFDFDDAIFVRSSGGHSASKLKRFSRTLGVCDLVWAGNHYLAKHAERFNDRVIVIPTAVEKEKYLVSPPKPDDVLDLVWIGSQSTRKHLMTVMPALEHVAKLIPNLRLKIVADFSIESSVLNVIAIPWTSEGEAEALASSHIGIAPLPDNPFTRGKCGLKILQYMASGLPVIATPVGVNGELVQDDVTGYTALDHEDWVSAVQRLASDRELRERLGRHGREVCHVNYSLDVVFLKLANSLSYNHVYN